MGHRVQLPAYRKPRLGFLRALSTFASGNPEPFKVGSQNLRFRNCSSYVRDTCHASSGTSKYVACRISERSILPIQISVCIGPIGRSTLGPISGKPRVLGPRLQLVSMCIPISTCLQISSRHGFLLVIIVLVDEH